MLIIHTVMNINCAGDDFKLCVIQIKKKGMHLPRITEPAKRIKLSGVRYQTRMFQTDNQ